MKKLANIDHQHDTVGETVNLPVIQPRHAGPEAVWRRGMAAQGVGLVVFLTVFRQSILRQGDCKVVGACECECKCSRKRWSCLPRRGYTWLWSSKSRGMMRRGGAGEADDCSL